MQKKKVLYILSTLKRSGTLNVVFNIIKNLDRDYFEPYILTLSPEPQISMWDDFKGINVHLNTLNLSRIEAYFFAVKKIGNFIKEIKPDIIHTHGFRPDFLVQRYFGQYKQVSTLHNYPLYDYTRLYGNFKGKVLAYLHMDCIKKIDEPIACSRSISEDYQDNNKINIEYIQNGVDAGLFKPVSNELKLELRKKLNLPLDKKIFIGLGKQLKRKNNETIISAFGRQEIPENIEMFFAGEGPEYNNIKELSKNNPKIKLLGNITNVSEYLQASDFFISASLAEGLPNAVMEAMACGLPCILSDIRPHREIFEYNKSAGLFFESKNDQKLAELIKFLVNNENIDYHRKDVRNIIENHLSAEIMSQNYQNLYKKILGV